MTVATNAGPTSGHIFSILLFYSILSFGKVRVKKPKLCNTSTEYQMPSSPLKSAPALEPFFSILFTQGCFFYLFKMLKGSDRRKNKTRSRIVLQNMFSIKWNELLV